MLEQGRGHGQSDSGQSIGPAARPAHGQRRVCQDVQAEAAGEACAPLPVAKRQRGDRTASDGGAEVSAEARGPGVAAAGSGASASRRRSVEARTSPAGWASNAGRVKSARRCASKAARAVAQPAQRASSKLIAVTMTCGGAPPSPAAAAKCASTSKRAMRGRVGGTAPRKLSTCSMAAAFPAVSNGQAKNGV